MDNNMKIQPIVKFVKTHPDAQLPKYETLGAAGMDLCTIERFIIQPGERRLVDTGLKIEIPKGYEAQVRPRSGLALKHGVTVLNSPGTIDSDYRGVVRVILINHGNQPFEAMCPDRIAQLVISPVTQVNTRLVVEEDLSETARGTDGFGSTNK